MVVLFPSYFHCMQHIPVNMSLQVITLNIPPDKIPELGYSVKSMTMEGKICWYYEYMFKVWFKSPNSFWTLSTPMIYVKWVKTDGKIKRKVGECANRLMEYGSHAERVYIQWKTAMAVSRPLVFGCHRDSLSGAMGVRILSQQNLCHYPTVTRVSHQSLRYLCAHAHRIYQ